MIPSQSKIQVRLKYGQCKLHWLRRFILLLILSSPNAQAADLLILTHDFPPYNYREKDKFIGINTEIIDKVLKAEGIAYELEVINWARAQEIVQHTPNTGLLAAGRSKVRETKYAWIGPLVSSTSYLFKLSAREDIKVTSLDDLKHYRLAITRRGVMSDFFRNLGLSAPDNLIFVSKASDTYRALFQNRADLIIGSELTTPYNVKNFGYELSAVEPTIELKTEKIQNHLAVNKNYSPELIARCNTRIKAMWESGEIDRIIDTYRLIQKVENQ